LEDNHRKRELIKDTRYKIQTTSINTNNHIISGTKEQTMYYLSEKIWSHRFEKRFFTIKCDDPSTSYETSPYSESDIGGRTKLPAFYYTVEVCAGSTDPLKIFRRYSEFEWLHHKLKSDPLLSASSSADENAKMFPTLPPKTSFCQVQTDDFRHDRQIELKEFLDDVLSTPGCARHPAMKSFLLLNQIYGEEDDAGSEADEIVDLEALAKLKEQCDKEGVEDDCVTPPTEEEAVTEEEPVEEIVVETAVAVEIEEEVVAAAVEEETTEEAKEEEEIAQEPPATEEETTEIAQELEPATTEDKAEEVAEEPPAPPAEEVAEEVEAPPTAVEDTTETEEEVVVDADDIPTEALKEESTPPEEETKEPESEVEVKTTSPPVEEESEKEETPAEEEVVEEAKTESPSPPAEEESEKEEKTELAVEKVKEKAAEVTTETA